MSDGDDDNSHISGLSEVVGGMEILSKLRNTKRYSLGRITKVYKVEPPKSHLKKIGV